MGEKESQEFWAQEYWDVDLIIEGALDWSSTFYNEDEMNEWAKSYYEAGQESQGYLKEKVHGEIYIYHHDHPPLEEGEECQCRQFDTDHHPAYSWGPVPTTDVPLPEPPAQEG
jgi:hypothetical protein